MTPTTRHGTRRALSLIISIVLVLLSLSGCITVIGGGSSAAGEETESRGTDRHAPREHLFDTPRNTVMDTPWFTVSSVIVRVQRTPPETTIVIPADPAMREYLSLTPNAIDADTTIPGNRFLFDLGIMTDGVPPFTPNPERYRYPDLHE